jgi:hypothetical protein
VPSLLSQTMNTKSIIHRASLSAFFVAFLVVGASVRAADWVDLFDGKSLKGWVQRGGSAKYRVEEGQIIGTTVPHTPNSFLCTEKNYANFILEVEFLVDSRMNSGIQIRSNSLKKFNQGRVHGYQVEIDPSERAWSAGIYDESRRGWLNDLEKNPAAQKAFKQNEWNQYRVKAVGDHIQTWINGVPAADLHDALTPSGFIALQVHGVGDRKDAMEVRWRNVRLQDLGPAQPLELIQGNFLSSWVRADGEPVTGGWEVNDGVLTRRSRGGDIYTRNEFGDFELNIEWKISQGGNSGIKYRMTKYGKSLLGLEYQVLDDDVHPDGKLRKGRRTSGALYDVFACRVRTHPKPVGEWNQTRIVAQGTRVEHWLNGEMILAYDTTTQAWQEEIAASKFPKNAKFGENPWGKIMLQDHGDEVAYRNVTILPLPPVDD